MFNKKAAGVVYGWVYGLVSLFAIGVLYIIFDQVFLMYIVPTIKNQANATVSNIDPGTVATIFGNIDQYMAFWHMLPFILFAVVVIYMILVGILKEREQDYLQ
jgi:ascorbate-specific PTS system EIIC-type component UlaA